MRNRKPEEERTSFQEHGPYDPRIDSKADVAIVYGLDRDFEMRIGGWGRADYRLHLMTGVSWGSYADYVRGEWDSSQHYDDAQTATGGFRLEHGMSQGHDIYYMMPSMPYVHYLAEKLHRVVDAGAQALHLEEPEFWVRAGYEQGFQRAWAEYYGEPWQDPASSPDARYRCEKLKQFLYTRALAHLFKDIKVYAASKGVHDFKCYVPTHSLVNYAHWRIVSPESRLLTIPDCDGMIGQVWTGTSRTPTVYRGEVRQRTFEAGYCEYAACAAIVRDTDFRLWQLADPIEDNPNYAWEDYRRCWECDVTASLLSPENVRFEIMPWPERVFTRSYPKENLDSKPLSVLLDKYIQRCEREGKHELAQATRRAAVEFDKFLHEHQEESRRETLGFANLAEVSDQLRFGDILGGSFAFYKYLSTWPDQVEAQTLRDAVSAFYHDPTDEREYIPAGYATELQVVFNALADMDWPGDYEWIHGQTEVGLAIADTLMYQRGDPAPSDPDLSSFYGLAMPLVKHGTALTLVQLERLTALQPFGGLRAQDNQGESTPHTFTAPYLNGVRVLLLTYEGMKPTSPEMHRTLVDWVWQGNALLIFGNGDAYNTVREWWNQGGLQFASPQEHLTELLGLGRSPAPGIYTAGQGYVIVDACSPADLAHRVDGADRVIAQVKRACANLGMPWVESNTLAFRRGPYVAASGMDESVSPEPTTIPGRFVNLYDPRLGIVEDPQIAPDTRWLLVDLSRYKNQACVVAAAGRVNDEAASDHALTFAIAGMVQTMCAVRVLLPTRPERTLLDDKPVAAPWDVDSRTALLEFPNAPSGVSVRLEW
jgi:hypothetical protein